ncbi:hypothetical protein LT40_08750 [Pseudomonas rhizosphaerae]|uniref:Uncharacterized protein n=1 Tax=Pseudomonas rhizosphaerae TaxID=216142 RepID=A0A089YPI2_9PSED|nr:hypothetical protein [Pseudomonas rhizosphaerae]AIS17484.1 hypothetical protein LT40_08750 [Pseudomonas rhizosphaerae]
MAIGKLMQHQLEEILSAGAALELSAKGRMPSQLIDLAKCAKRGGSHLTLTDAGEILHHLLLEIARDGQGHVTLKD